MKNENTSLILKKENVLDSQSPLHLTPSIQNKTNHYYNFLLNSKDKKTLTLVNQTIKHKNFTSSKYKNKMKYKNKLLSKHYNISTSSQKSFLNPIITEPSCKLEKFLPPKISKKSKTLIIDLDETLVHSFFDVYPPRKPEISFEILIDKKNTQVYTLIRPGAAEFLEKMSEFFELVIFTASLSIYALPIINFIDKNKKCEFKLFREHCCIINNGFVKDLKRLDRDLNNLIILDNNPNCYFLNKENGFPIKTWTDDTNDKELYKIIPYLKFLSNENIEDTRVILSKVKIDNRINFYKFNKIMEMFKKRKLIIKDNINIVKEKVNKEENKEETKINENESNSKLNINNFDNKIFEKNDNNNIINSIKNSNNEEKNNSENNKSDDSDIKNNDIKLNFKNKIKSSKENKFFISKEKDNKENYSENINIKNNLFNQKNSYIQTNSQKTNLINTSIKNSSRVIFIKDKNFNSNKNISVSQINKDNQILKTQLAPCMIQKHNLKPIIHPINFASKFGDEPKNNNENSSSKKNTLFNKYLSDQIFNDLSPLKINNKNESDYFYDIRNNTYFDYHKIRGIHKCTQNINTININRSKIEKNSIFKNFKSINSQSNNNLNKTKSEFKDVFNSLKITTRSLSSTRREPNISKKYSKKQDLIYRCLSSRQNFFNKYNNNSLNEFSLKNSTKYQDFKNHKKRLNNENQVYYI